MGLWKNVTLAYNFVLWLVGLAIIASGAYIQIRYGNYIPSLGSVLSYLPLMIIGAGSCAAVMTFFGCLGSLRENFCMIVMYATTLALAFGIEVAGVAAFFHYRNELTRVIKQETFESLKSYGQSHTVSLTEAWNRLQRDYMCCGVDNHYDWENAAIYAGVLNKDVPDACCLRGLPHCGRGVRALDGVALHDRISVTGCYYQLTNYLEEKYILFGTVACGFAMILIVGVILTVILAYKSRTIRRMKR